MPTVQLTTSDNGRTIEARKGDEIILRLPENPTTGYRWHIDRANGHIEALADEYHLQPEPQIGSGGVREFRFQAVTQGTAHLALKHWREWEGDSSVTERFAVDITIA